MKVADFGADTTGVNDSSPAIEQALAAAAKEGAAVQLNGQLRISRPIILNTNNAAVPALFGEGMDKTTIKFNWAQAGDYVNASHDRNELDVSKYAGIVVSGRDTAKIADTKTTLAEFALVYDKTDDYYRPGQSYFGMVNGIYVDDSDNVHIDKVEVSGANRAGIYFDSNRSYRESDPNLKDTYKQLLIDGKIDGNHPGLPIGDNNRVTNSKLHNNRVGGLMFGYQRNFVAEGNNLLENGDSRDGGTGYGIASVSGTYNFGVKFTGNSTYRNMRKGLDIHDGDDITIVDNTLTGDRLYGIEVYNRQFPMTKVNISGNTIVPDSNNRLVNDDDLGAHYQLYQGIGLIVNEKWNNLPVKATGDFTISNNTIKNFSAYKNPQRQDQSYGILFRNREAERDYRLTIENNHIEGPYSSKATIATLGESQSFYDANGKKMAAAKPGKGSGTIFIRNNTIKLDEQAGMAPIWNGEEFTDGGLRGEVHVTNNKVEIKQNNAIRDAFLLGPGNANSYLVQNNLFTLSGDIGALSEQAIGEIFGRANNKQQPTARVIGNSIIAASVAQRPREKSWLTATNVQLEKDRNKLLPVNGLAVPQASGVAGARGAGVKPTAAVNTVNPAIQPVNSAMQPAAPIGVAVPNRQPSTPAAAQPGIATNPTGPSASPSVSGQPSAGAATVSPNGTPARAAVASKQGGLMVDTARHFYTIDELKGFVDLVRRSGGQFLHLHLSDDQNYTLESDLLGQSLADAVYEPAGYLNRKQGNRFYSRAQIAALVRYANSAGVELVPEIDLPGHANFIYRLLKDKDATKANRIFSGGNANVDEALTFTKELYAEVAAQFRGNSKHFHMGGDEFAGAVSNNPAYVAYANAVAADLQRQGFTARIWNDAVLTAQLGKLSKDIEITYWDWDGNREDPAERAENLKQRATVGELLRQGYRVLNYNQHYLYHNVDANSADTANSDRLRLQNEQWHLGRWDETNRHNEVDARQVYGAAVAIWNDGSKPYPLPAADLQRFIEPQLRLVIQKVREAEGK